MFDKGNTQIFLFDWAVIRLNMKPKQQGFTLIELMVVIAIIGILVTIAIVAIDPIRMLGNARDGRARSDLNQVKAALQLFHNENTRYPTAVEFGSTCSGAAGCVDFTPTYMRQLPTGVNYGVDTTTDDYDAGMDLNRPDVVGNDSGSYTRCQPLITGVSQKPDPGNSDYFICPD